MEDLSVDPTFVSDLPYNGVKDSKWYHNGQYMINNGFPLQIDLELNLTCNFNCIMCIRDSIKTKKQYMDLETVYDLINQCGENKMESIKFQYRGEPLLYPDFINVIKKAKENNLFVHFNTNGSLLDLEMIKALIFSGLDKIIISIESMFPHIYNQIRVGGNFDKLLANITNLRFLRDSYEKEKPIIEVFATVQETNKREIEEGIFSTFWKNLADSITIAECFDLYDNTEDDIELPNWHCGQLWQRLIVLVDGEVIPCCAGIDYKDSVVYNMGNINKSTIEEIWNCHKLEKIRELHSEGKSHKVEMCRKCRLRKSVIRKRGVKL